MTYVVLLLCLLAMVVLSVCPAESADGQTAQPEKTDDARINVALLQMTSIGEDQAANLKKAEEWCRNAAAMGADIALMPEMWNIGYADYPGKTRESSSKWMAKAVARDSEYVKHFETLAKELKMAIVVTYLEKWPKAPRNSATLIDRTGKQVFTYAKVHTCDFITREAACTPGDDFKVAELDTARGKIRVGIMICYDREFPESARVMMLKGAELILIPNACTIPDVRIHQLEVRAYENALAVAMTNYASPHPSCNGRSVAFDEKARLLVQAQQEEGIFMATVNTTEIRDHQKRTIWGNAFRRPDHYKDITDDRVAPIYERNNAFGEKFESKER